MKISDFFTIEMTGDDGTEIRVTVRKSKVDSLQRRGATVTVLLCGQQPLVFNVKDCVEARTLYLQVAQEMEK